MQQHQLFMSALGGACDVSKAKEEEDAASGAGKILEACQIYCCCTHDIIYWYDAHHKSGLEAIKCRWTPSNYRLTT